jgi:ribonuclease III
LDGADDFADALGHRFSDRDLLRRAFVHKSYRNENPTEGEDNERLEFLGDAVLSLVVGHLLMERRPEASEGDLSRMRAAVVNEAALARVAEGLSLGERLRLGRGEEQTGGRRKPSLLADACEALIGAIYLDGGFAAAYASCARLLDHPLTRAVETSEGDAKTRLQEWTQARVGEPPAYTLAAQEGPDHSLTFEVVVGVAGRELARGRGRSKKEAEQAAAQAALDLLRREQEP